MGGISSTNLVLSGSIPVIAHSAFCPVLDTYNQIFLHPWSGGLPKDAMGIIYKFDRDESGGFIYDESRLAGFNPARNAKAQVYPVPVKFWQCIDDDTVAYEVTRAFVDRIRENVGFYPKRALNELINMSITSTLSRTFSTSFSTALPLLAMFIFGGETIRGFVFAILLGVIVGTYSTIFIASPIAYDIQEKQAKKAQK